MTFGLKGLLRQIQSLCSQDEGQGLTEYALILALIAVAAIVALSVVGGSVTSELSTIGSSVPS